MAPASPRRRALRAALAATACLAALGIPTAYAQIASAPHRYSVDDAPADTAVLVLGAGLRPDGRPSDFLAARLDVALELYGAGKAPRIILSGARGEPEAMRDYLTRRGIPADVLTLDVYGVDTYSSCARAIAVFGLRRVVLVSQAYHLPRAVTLCRELGVDASGVGDTTMRRLAPSTWWFGVVREGGANIKAAWNVTTHRDTVLAPPDPSPATSEPTG